LKHKQKIKNKKQKKKEEEEKRVFMPPRWLMPLMLR